MRWRGTWRGDGGSRQRRAWQELGHDGSLLQKLQRERESCERDHQVRQRNREGEERDEAGPGRGRRRARLAGLAKSTGRPRARGWIEELGSWTRGGWRGRARSCWSGAAPVRRSLTAATQKQRSPAREASEGGEQRPGGTPASLVAGTRVRGTGVDPSAGVPFPALEWRREHRRPWRGPAKEQERAESDIGEGEGDVEEKE